MDIIILEGNSSCGKTTTLGMVLLALLINGAQIKRFTALQIPSDMDFEAELDYQGKKVAIYSKGDTIADCNAAISKYSLAMIDALVIAYSTKKTPLTIPPKDKSVVVPKAVAIPALSEVQANANDAYNIVSRI